MRERPHASPRPAALAALLAGLLPAVAPPAHAGANCSISSVGLNFGSYDPVLASPDDVAATITVTCVYVPPGATNVSYTVSIGNGLHGSSATSRAMAANGVQLGYNVFTDATYTRLWGTGSGGTTVATGSVTVGPGAGNGTRTETHVVYGRVPALQDAVPGTYLDTLVLTLTY